MAASGRGVQGGPDRAGLRERTNGFEQDFSFDAGQVAQMPGKQDADHASVWTSTESTGGRSRTMGAQVSPASAET